MVLLRLFLVVTCPYIGRKLFLADNNFLLCVSVCHRSLIYLEMLVEQNQETECGNDRVRRAGACRLSLLQGVHVLCCWISVFVLWCFCCVLIDFCFLLGFPFKDAALIPKPCHGDQYFFVCLPCC